MRKFAYSLAAAALFSWSGSSIAGDRLLFGPPPAWVVPPPKPDSPVPTTDAPVAILLNDQQLSFQQGRLELYNEVAILIQNEQGLAVGNISVPWQPATDTVTVNKLLIRRGDRTIDVLASGQSFTTVRRETNLEAATLDGQLTANIQPEGLQEGDIIEMATTVVRVDPVLQGRVESMFAVFAGLPIALGRARVSWPRGMRLNTRQSELLPQPKLSSEGGRQVLELVLRKIEPPAPPKDAPPRFALGLYAEASDYASWDEVAGLMRPLFAKASVIPAAGPLRQEVERIRAAGKTNRERTELALALVQKRVRYVALLMGTGNYRPASAEETWNRRFGDCKGKTALLLGLLAELGIPARPVLVHSMLGDSLPERLPSLGAFNHVIVQATVDGAAYFLDGTRSGDRRLDQLAPPNFAWGLPVVPNSSLIPIVPPPLARPSTEAMVEIDASEGVRSAAPTKVDVTLRGDEAVQLNALLSLATGKQRDDFLREYWKSSYRFVTVGTTQARFDTETGEYRLTMAGTARLDWDGGLSVPGSTLAFKADFERPPGPRQDAPIAIGFPAYEQSRTTIRFPPGFFKGKTFAVAPVRETLAGVEYRRSATVDGSTLVVETSERSLVSEISYAEARKAEARLRTLWDEDVLVRLPSSYRPTAKDIAALKTDKPQSADDYLERGLIYLDEGKFDEAIADFTEAHKLNRADVWPLANRAVAYVWKRDFQSANRDLAAADAIKVDNKVALRARGMMAEFQGDNAKALAIYDRILLRNSDDIWVRLRRAEIRRQQGKREDAMLDIDAVIAEEPDNAFALAQRAYILAEREDWVRAEAATAAALAADPNNDYALTAKAMIAAYRKDYAGALELTTRALERNPDNHLARLLHSQLLKRQRGKTGVMKSFDEAVARAPTGNTALLARAYAHLEARDFAAADKDIAAALAIAPSDPWAMQASASLAMAKGDYNAAISALNAALAAYPANGPMLAQRAEANRHLGKYDLALADTERAQQAGLESPSLRLLRINILVQMGNLSTASAETDRLVQENPTSEFAMVAAGKSYSAMGLHQKAMDSFDRAIRLNPVAYIYLNRSQVRPFADTAGKLADLDAALKIDPQHEDVLAEKAEILSRAGRHPEAIDLYERAIDLALDGSYLQMARAIALERAGRATEARNLFEAERGKAKTAGDFNRLCWSKVTNDVLLQSAWEDCREALRRDPKHQGAAESLAMVLLKLGRLEEALTAYNDAISSKPGANVYMGRAIVRARLKDTAGARDDANEARRRRPNIDDIFAEYGLNPKAEFGTVRSEP